MPIRRSSKQGNLINAQIHRVKESWGGLPIPAALAGVGIPIPPAIAVRSDSIFISAI